MDKLLQVKISRRIFSLTKGLFAPWMESHGRLPRGDDRLVGESGCGKSVTSLSVMRLITAPGASAR